MFIYHKETAKTAEMFLMGREGKWQQPSLYLPPLAQSNALNLEMEKQRPRGKVVYLKPPSEQGRVEARRQARFLVQ